MHSRVHTFTITAVDKVNATTINIASLSIDHGITCIEEEGVVLQDHTNFAVFFLALHRLNGDRSEEHRKVGGERSSPGRERQRGASDAFWRRLPVRLADGSADTLVSAWYRHLAHTVGGD
ncbi:unnamed protein product [Danaus chrysippus]|uniref:(African queen) hypothetical protein n=1 Tax=Danaus chrysippus TaxID=151541 RepID=A0A8J2QCH8_9NEOP|nr:unnamed protein product [Danaus chrysippus]